MNNVKTLNPFRPGSGLFPSCLAGRKAMLDVFSARLYSTITGSPRNIIVHGHKRMGKTCFLMQMENISFEKKLLTVSTITSPDTVKSFVENLAVRIHSEVKNQDLIENGQLQVLLTELQSLPQTASLAEIEVAFNDLMLHIWAKIESKVPALFISIDDIDLVSDADKALLFIHNVTQTLHRKNCPFIFAVSMTTEFYDTQRAKHLKLIENFEPLEAGKLQMSSLQNAICVPLWELELEYDESVVKEIARLAGGFPYYLQHIAHYVFDEMDVEFDTLALRRGYEKALQYLKRDIFAPLEQELPQNEKTIYVSLYRLGWVSFSELLNEVKLPRGSVASCIKRLKRRQLLIQNNKKYFVHDKLLGEYLEKRADQEEIR